MTDAIPTILLLFANAPIGDHRYLSNLQREWTALTSILRDSGRRWRTIVDKSVSLADVFRLFEEYGEHTVGVHFAGHAHPDGLMIQDREGNVVPLDVSGLAGRLAEMPKLRWLFLNACKTRPLVDVIHREAPVTVIATERLVEDEAAVEFAEQFYESLTEGRTLAKSLELARDRLRAHSGEGALRMLCTAEMAESDEPAWRLVDPPDGPGGSESRLVEPDELDELEREIERETARCEGAEESELLRVLQQRRVDIKRGRLEGKTPVRGEKLGGWRLIEALGRGGFGVVWAAQKPGTPTTAAVKILHAQFNDDRDKRLRFRRGAKKMAGLDHPNIVRIIEKPATADGWHFFVMEWLTGGTLDAAVREGRIDRMAGLRCVVEIAEAVAFAHAARLVHRDVKPSNILLDAEGRAKLTDFDLVRARDTFGGTRGGGGMGTFTYAAPEAIKDASGVDERCDVYGLGMTAFCVLLGGREPPGMLPGRGSVLDTVEGFDTIKHEILRAIAVERDLRHETARAFAAAFRAALDATGPDGRRRNTPPTSAAITSNAPVAPETPCRPALVYIPAGEFVMGSPPNEPGRGGDEQRHSVRLTTALWMAETPVTVSQYRALVDGKPPGDDARPKGQVSWWKAVEFCNALSEAEGLEPAYSGKGPGIRLDRSASGYRLPTEAEWEYACRAGSAKRFCSGDDPADLERVGWFRKNARNRIRPVAQKEPNRWGLYDMHGNTLEWCHDLYGDYPRGDLCAALTDPECSPANDQRVVRGGYCFSVDNDCRSAKRDAAAAGSRQHKIAFRVVRRAPSDHRVGLLREHDTIGR